MEREALGLTLAGLLLGGLVLSATVFARLRPLEQEVVPEALAVAVETLLPAAETGEPEEVIPVMAEFTEAEERAAAGPYAVELQASDPIPGERLLVCDGLGCPLEDLTPDSKGKAVLGPLVPGRYSLQRGQAELASFLLRDDGSLGEASGRLWTDGAGLYLERFIPGTVRILVTLGQTGYYSIALWDQAGRVWSRDFYVSEKTPSEADNGWERSLEFQGLPAGIYTVVRCDQPLDQVEVLAGEIAERRIKIDK